MRLYPVRFANGAFHNGYNPAMLTPQEVERLSEEFETKTPQEIIKWAIDTFWPQVAMSSSF